MKYKKDNMNYKVEGTGKTLLFIHGLSDNLLYWEFLARNLKNDYQVIRIDLRGHGESKLGSDEITIDLYANDLLNLLDDLNISEVNLIGFSMGGAVALDFTIRYPEKVSSLVLISAFARADSHTTDILNQFIGALKSSFEDFYDMILPMTLCKNIIAEHEQELEILKEISSQNANVESYIKACEACINFDVENELSQINVPTVILAGRYDEISSLDAQKRIYNKIKSSKLIVFENAKHNLLVGKNNEKILNILKKHLK